MVRIYNYKLNACTEMYYLALTLRADNGMRPELLSQRLEDTEWPLIRRVSPLWSAARHSPLIIFGKTWTVTSWHQHPHALGRVNSIMKRSSYQRLEMSEDKLRQHGSHSQDCVNRLLINHRVPVPRQLADLMQMKIVHFVPITDRAACSRRCD